MTKHVDLQLREVYQDIVKKLYDFEIDTDDVIINETPKNFEGDFTVVIFSVMKAAKKKPEEAGDEIGRRMQEKLDFIESFNVIKGFLNFRFKASYWEDFLQTFCNDKNYGFFPESGETEAVEYCGPNTNKPLHLGHIRNMLLGWSVIKILEANGKKVIKFNIYNDRGIAICKSMVAWMEKGEGKTPENTGIKGDHFVGKFYVMFDKLHQEEMNKLIAEGMEKETAKKEAPIMKRAYDVLRKWENDDSEILEKWKMMNNWVYAGYEETYKTIGVEFDKNYYESETYLLGKGIVEEGLQKGVYFKKSDSSVWVNLEDEGLDEKLLLRSDGTSVYLTQDLGTADQRFSEYPIQRCIYVVANEQDYHFQVLKKALKKLGRDYAENGIYHLSYGMVDLPEGRMKSREGKVVDADDLLNEMFETAEKYTRELGKLDDFDDKSARELYQKLGLGALKFFILRVDPKKRMLFNPVESIDFQGQTGPFVQYTYARIQSVLRKEKAGENDNFDGYQIDEKERLLLRLLYLYPQKVKEAGDTLDPSVICHFAFTLAKEFNGFYAAFSILNAEDKAAKIFRLKLSAFVGETLKKAFTLIGVDMPEKM